MEDIANSVGSAILQSYMLNLSSGGQCRVAGFIPNAFNTQKPLVGLVLGSNTWWLQIEKSDFEALRMDPSTLPLLAQSVFHDEAGHALPASAPQLEIRCFLAHVHEPEESPWQEPRGQYFFEFSTPGVQGESFLTKLIPAPLIGHKSILSVLPKEIREAHDAGNARYS